MWDTAEYIHIYLYPIQEYVNFYSGTKSMILRVQLQRQNQVFSISVNHSIEQIRENIKPQWPQAHSSLMPISHNAVQFLRPS